MRLSYKLKGKTVEITLMNFKDKEISHKLTNIGFVPKAKFKVLDYNKSKKVLHLLIFNVQYVLREKDCKDIHVKVIKD